MNAHQLIELLQNLPEDQKNLPILTSDNEFWLYDLSGHAVVEKVFEGRENEDHPEAELCLCLH